MVLLDEPEPGRGRDRNRRLEAKSTRDEATEPRGEVKREIGSMREQEPKKPGGPPGHSRRDFLRGSGAAAATAVLSGQATLVLDEVEAAPVEPKLISGTVDITLDVNGEHRSCKIEPRSTLLDVLRHQLDVTGPKRVCDRGSCGSCTTIVNGDPVYSCTTLAVSCKGKRIQTVESFDTGETGVPHAFHQNDALMCGYCTPGFVTACKAFLDKNPNATLEEVRKGIEGNICRCGTYVGVLNAALAAAKAMKGA
jgi:xanthine dehydrogenase YagT iron-sulfur-binding subunit